MDRTYLRIIYRYATLFIALIGVILITVNVAGAHNLYAPTKTPPPPRASSPCGALVATEGSGGFPRIDLSKCTQPDTAQPPGRQPWRPIAVGGPVCVNWTLYHTNQA